MLPVELSPMYNADTPLANAIGAHLYRKTASFHTPGHKGRAPVLKSLSTLSADLTELPDTGSLYDGGDAIEAADVPCVSRPCCSWARGPAAGC